MVFGSQLSLSESEPAATGRWSGEVTDSTVGVRGVFYAPVRIAIGLSHGSIYQGFRVWGLGFSV